MVLNPRAAGQRPGQGSPGPHLTPSRSALGEMSRAPASPGDVPIWTTEDGQGRCCPRPPAPTQTRWPGSPCPSTASPWSTCWTDRQLSTPHPVASPSWATAPPEPQFPREPAGKVRARGKGQGPPRCPLAFGSGEAQRVVWAHPASSAHLNSRVTRVPALPRWSEEWLHPAPCGPLSPSACGLGPPRAAAPTCRQWTVVPPGRGRLHLRLPCPRAVWQLRSPGELCPPRPGPQGPPGPCGQSFPGG